jgi:multiple sugar transport system ATP-binding protein
MVFQSYALYPHLTVGENLGFALKTAGAPRAEIEAKVGDAARILKLDALLDRLPKQLSGGQRQRVAIGRAIVRQPAAFLFDEPLSNLDAALRGEMRYEIAKLRQSLNATMIYVTHDQVEAMTLADRIVVLQGGVIEQVGSPRELYDQPANLFVAQFIGSPRMNLAPVRPSADGLDLGGRTLPLTTAPEAATVGVRPEHIRLTTPDAGWLTGKVEVVEYLGADAMVFVACDEVGVLTVREAGTTPVRIGEPVGLDFPPEAAHLFDAGGHLLSRPG